MRRHARWTVALVALIDSLADRGLLERRRNPDDRRLHALHLTPAGERLLHRVAQIGRAHDDAMFGSLTTDERGELRALLARGGRRARMTSSTPRLRQPYGG